MIILARSLLFAFAASQRALLNSQYHNNGPLSPTIFKPAEALLRRGGRELTSIMQNLQITRNIYLQEQPMGISGYTQAYKKLCQYLTEGFLPDTSLYRMIGWYNVQALHKILLQRLIALQEEPEPLIQSLAWMKLTPQSPFGFIEKEHRENRKIEGLFRNLKLNLSLEHLRQLNSIVTSPLVISKRTYMEHYALKNLQNLLQAEIVLSKDIIWLFEAVTAAMVDRGDLTSKFQVFLKGLAAVSTEDCEGLMRTYTLRGRIDKSIYQSLIRPYLFKNMMKDAGGIVEAIKFTILSESEDYLLLKNLFELLRNEIPQNSKQLYELHILTHYLRVKGQSALLSAGLEKKLIDFCRHRSEAKATINHLVLDNESTQQLKNRNEYISECLKVDNHRLTELQSTKRSVFEEAFSSQLRNLATEQTSLYEKPSFCCFELDFCLHDSQTKGLIDLEVSGMQYVFSSDRLTRWQQIRQELLEYYGIKVNRLNYYKFLEKPYLNCADSPRKTGKFFAKK